uniref:Uncharacterized protein n=1 Tax=Equus asinus TaxID=9793 RepID=A0A9L0JNH0_EQUAS
IHSSGIAESYGISIFTFLGSLHTVFHSGYASFNYHQQYTRFPFSPHPLQHILFLVLLIIVILMGVRRYLIVILIYVSLITNDVEHLFMFLLAILASSLEKYLFISFAHLKKLFY